MLKSKKKISVFLVSALVAGMLFNGTTTAFAANLFSDSFESGITNWTASAGTWIQATDGTKVYEQTSTSTEGRTSAGSQSWTNYSVQSRVKVTNFNSNRAMVCGRYKDANNYYAASLYNGKTLEIRKKVGGSSTTLVSKSLTLTTGQWYTVKLEMSGSTIKVYVDGTLQLTATDTSLTSGAIGFVSKSVAEFDDVVVADSSSSTTTPTPTATATPTATPTTTATPTATPTTTAAPTATPTATATPTTPVTGTVYYVSTTGSDSNAGTLAAPFKSITKAVSSASAGTTIYVRGGTYSLSSLIDLTKSGSSGKTINILAYNGEKPVLDFAGEGSGVGTFGIRITGNYWNIKGFEVKNAAGKGIRIYGSYNTIENCVTHDNNDSGLYIGLNKTDSNDGTKAAYNKVINCDSYLNIDLGGSTGDGGNADGFSCKLNPGTGNYFYGCRSWENSDDGWDLYMAQYPITIEKCYTWHNGDPKSFNWSGSTWGGNGSGFKLGGGTSYGQHVVKNCVAFDINYGKNANHKAFDQNGSSGALGAVKIYNCVAFNSGYGFYFAAAPTQGGNHTFKNNVSFNEANADTNLYSGAVQANNSWNLSVTANSADFASTALTDAKAARNSDGSLANNNFARLVSGSDLIDKGVNVGISYLGAAPDLGAYEKQ